MKNKIKLDDRTPFREIPTEYKVRKEIYHGIRFPISYPFVQIIINGIIRNLRDKEDNEE
jgi:hypothetical protein